MSKYVILYPLFCLYPFVSHKCEHITYIFRVKNIFLFGIYSKPHFNTFNNSVYRKPNF